MRHPAAALKSLRHSQEGCRLILIGANEFLRQTFRGFLELKATETVTLTVDVSNIRYSGLELNTRLSTAPMPWDLPLVWVSNADPLLGAISYPDDFPKSRHCVVLQVDQPCYYPPSFTPVQLTMDAAQRQELVRWFMDSREVKAELDAVRFLATEYKEDFTPLPKLLDQLALEIYPRTVISTKDLQREDSGWDATFLLHAITAGEEHNVLSEMAKASETFHYKGILTILIRRVSLLIQVAAAVQLSGGQPEDSEVKPWVWKQNAELLEKIPLKRLSQWAFLLDNAYVSMSRSSSQRLILITSLLEMSRSI